MANINIGGRLHSTATGNVVAGANEILDDTKGKKQSVINQETDEALAGKQAALVSGTNIKTVNGESILGSGNIQAGDPDAIKYSAQTLTDEQKTQARTNIGAYNKPVTGIPATDLASAAQASLGKADTAYQKPQSGVPKSDLASGVQDSLDLADTAVQAENVGPILPPPETDEFATKTQVTQLEAKVDGIPGSTTTEEIIRTDYTETSHTISAQGKWVSSPTGKSILVPVSPGQILKYQSGTNDAIVALLKTDTYVQGETADFCNDYQERFIPTDGQQVTLPTDCNYLYILVKTSSGYVDSREFLITQTPSVPGLTDKVEDLQDNITDLGQDISDLKDSVEYVEAGIGDMSISESVDLSLYEESSKAVDASGVWRVGTPKYKGVPVIPGRDYKIYAIAETLFSILAENAGNAGTSVDFATGYTSRIIIQDGDVYNFVAPVDALYLWVRVKDTSGNDVAPTIIESYSKTVVSELKKKMDNLAGLKHIYENIPVSLDSDGWEKPVTPGMVIALKKAAQASQIRYTAKKAYPTNTSPTTGAIGEHSGFPYSSTKEIRKYICWEVSQRTFMTAVNNQYGLFYTEDIASAYNISEYGYSYNGVNCGSYYGMVCSIFALWCLGFNVPWDTKQFAYLTKIGKLIRLENQTAQGVHICDLIWLSGHTRLVTGVQRDEWGNVINVKVTESASNVAVINYTAESFQAYLTRNNCILYRATDLYKNTDYELSEFVAVCGESELAPYPYNDYICHYAGDYAAMRTDQPTWINYSLGNYTGMKIRKDGVTWITIPLDGSLHKVDISSYLDGAGKYEACLTDGVNDSELTHWQLVDAGCIYEDNGTTQKITFASSNGTPWWLQVCSDNGTAYCWYEITDADIAVGYVELDLASMITEQYGAVSGTMYIRVMYKADYGGVASEMVQM